MINEIEAAAVIRRLSKLKGYPRSWGQDENSAAAEQDAAAEAALIEAASSAPSMSLLRQFVANWERRHVEAPVPAVLYEAWRPRSEYTGARRGCEACGGSGWISRSYVADAIAGRNVERIRIEESEVNEWWERIRATPTCAQRVYEEAARCGCGSVRPEVAPDFGADARAYRDFTGDSE